MYCKIEEIDKAIIDKSLNYFPQEYIDILKNKSTFNESLVARYLISKQVKAIYGIELFLPEVDINNKPIAQNNIYWSISHKDNIVFISISSGKIGIDLELYKERDISLLDTFPKKEYDILGGKNWKNFYYLWTAKEALVKQIGLTLDDFNLLTLIGFKESNTTKTGNISFNKNLAFKYKNQTKTVLSGSNNQRIFSYTGSEL